MEIKVNIPNKIFYTLLIVILISLIGITAYAYTQSIPNPGHGADSVLVKFLDNTEKTLQNAIDTGDIISQKNNKVGIGTLSPKATLHVEDGNGYVRTSTAKDGGWFVKRDITDSRNLFWVKNGYDDTIFQIGGDGDVKASDDLIVSERLGIGTSSPEATLHVQDGNGYVRTSIHNDGGLFIKRAVTGSNDNIFRVQNGNDRSIFQIKGNGEVCINGDCETSFPSGGSGSSSCDSCDDADHATEADSADTLKGSPICVFDNCVVEYYRNSNWWKCDQVFLGTTIVHRRGFLMGPVVNGGKEYDSDIEFSRFRGILTVCLPD